MCRDLPTPYKWTCPWCSTNNEEEDFPDMGKALECFSCGKRYTSWGDELNE